MAPESVRIGTEKLKVFPPAKRVHSTLDIVESSSAALEMVAEASDMLVQPELESAPQDIPLKTSPIIDLIHRRLKATSKQIVRITLPYVLVSPSYMDSNINLWFGRP
jgi:hypothetical protein